MRQQFKKFGGFADVLSLRKQELQSNSFPQSEIRIARKLSNLEPTVQLRNFPSVEQIQDSGSELRLESFAKVKDLKHKINNLNINKKLSMTAFNIPNRIKQKRKNM